MSSQETMPCPYCKKLHARGDYKRVTGTMSRYVCSPLDIACECGFFLRHIVPIFFTGPYGWYWQIVPRDEKPRLEEYKDAGRSE